jgi:hypothetical protein
LILLFIFWKGKKDWRDGLMVIQGRESVQHLHKIFATQWMVQGGDIFLYRRRKYNPRVDDAGEDEVAIMPSFPGSKFAFYK